MIPDIHKTVIVTGASQGIGAGLVKAFLEREQRGPNNNICFHTISYFFYSLGFEGLGSSAFACRSITSDESLASVTIRNLCGADYVEHLVGLESMGT